MMKTATLFLLGGVLWLGFSPPVWAQERIGQIERIEKPPDGASQYERREPVSTVVVLVRHRGEYEDGFKDMPLHFGDEIEVRRGEPGAYRVIVIYDDPQIKQVKLAPGDAVRLVDRETVEAEGGLLAWFVGKLRASTKYIQAIAPGTQYAVQVVGDTSRVFVWEGEVQVTNKGAQPTTVAVKGMEITEALGLGQPSTPRVPRFDEVKEIILFGLDLDPVMRGRVTDEKLRQVLHEDLVRARFESRARRADVGAQVNLGHTYLFLGNYAEALKAFDEAEQISSRPAAIFNGRGVALTLLGRYDAAGQAFSRALSRDNESMFHNNLANLYLQQGALDEALDQYGQALERDQANAAPHNGRGVALLQRRAFTAAEAAFHTSIRLKERAVPHTNLGNAHLMRGDLTGAEAEYQKAIQLTHEDAAAWNNRGVSHLKQRQYQQAEGDFRRAIQASPGDPSPHLGLGLAYVGLNRTEAAVSAFITALDLDPSNRTTYRDLAYFFLTRASARATIQARLKQAAASAPGAAAASIERFIRFLQTLPAVTREDFDAAFEQFRIQAR